MVILADSRPPRRYKRQTHEPKDWERLLFMMDSSAIALSDNILKGVGRHPKLSKKKGGMKVHTVMKYHVGVPMAAQLTRGELTHEARRVEFFPENKRPVVLLTDNFDFMVEDISEVYSFR